MFTTAVKTYLYNNHFKGKSNPISITESDEN